MYQNNSISIEEIINYLYINKLKLFGFPFIGAVVVAIASLFIKNEYMAQANLLPSNSPNIGFSLFSDEGGISNLASSLLGGSSNEVNKYYVLLNSHSTTKKVIEKFDLINIYRVEESKYPFIEARNILNENTSFEAKEEGNFIIKVWDINPNRAKKMADYYVELLNEKNTEITTRDARNYREFIEKRYKVSVNKLEQLRKKLVAFQKEYGIIELPTQLQSYFKVIAELTAEKYRAEIQLNMLKNTTSSSNSALIQIQQELFSIEQKLNESYADTSNKDIILNFSELPEISSEYYELVKTLEIELEIQKFILPLYEQAKMEEAKSLPLVNIVDEPYVPERKDRPRRSILVILSGISFFILTTLYFIIKIHLSKNDQSYKSIFSSEH